MVIFDEIGKRITVTGQETVQKAKDIADIAKLNSKIGELNKTISLVSTEVGNLMVQVYQGIGAEELIKQSEGTVDNKQKQILEKIAEVKRLQNEISEYQEQIVLLKKITKCPNCNGEISPEDIFCSKCGFKIETTKISSGKICSLCGAVIPEDAEFCTNCGARVGEGEDTVHKICSSCGADLDEEAVFCANCGLRVS